MDNEDIIEAIYAIWNSVMGKISFRGTKGSAKFIGSRYDEELKLQNLNRKIKRSKYPLDVPLDRRIVKIIDFLIPVCY